MKMLKKNGGFTLVELVVVIAIMAILTGMGAVSYSGYIRGTKDSAVTAELEAVCVAVHAANARAGAVNTITVAPNGTISVDPEVSMTNGSDFVRFYGSGTFQGDLSGSSYENGAVWVQGSGWSAN